MPSCIVRALGAALAIAGAPLAFAASPVDHLLNLAATHAEEGVRRGAVNGLVSLRWQPKSQEDWRRLVAIGHQGLPLADALLATPDPAVQARTVQAIAEIAAAVPRARGDALDRLAQAGGAGQPPAVVAAAASGLLALKWPASDAEAKQVLLRPQPPWPLVDQLLQTPGGAHAAPLANALKELAEKPETAAEAKPRLDKLASAPVAPPPEPPKEKEPPPPKEIVQPKEKELPPPKEVVQPKEKEPPPPEIVLKPKEDEKPPEPKAIERPKAEEPSALKEAVAPDWRPQRPEDWAQVTGLGPKAMPVLDRFLGDPSAEVRLGAVRALGQVAEAHEDVRPPAFERLVRLATDARSDDALRQAAAAGFLRLKGPATDAERRPVAAAGKAAIPLLDGLLGDAAPDIRTRALACLMPLVKADPQSRPDTVARLIRVGRADQDPGVRKIAAIALGGLQWPATDAEFALAMRGDDPPWPLIGEMFETADEGLVGKLSDLIVRMARDDARARGAALELLPAVVRRSAVPSARKQAADLIERFCQSEDPTWAAKALGALVSVAEDDKALRSRSTARLLAIVTAQGDPRVREAAVAGLARLRWEPMTEPERRRIVAMGSQGIPLADALTRHPDPNTRATGTRILADMALRHRPIRDEAVQMLIRMATADRDLSAVEAANKALRTLDWPRTEKDWADLVAFGQAATRPLHFLVEDKDEDVRGRAVTALAQVAGASPGVAGYAIARLAHLARVERTPSVREAVIACLGRLRWPATDDDWKRVDDLGGGALCLLARLVRGSDAAAREKAIAKARESAPALFAAAERVSDSVALLDGLELRWTLGFLDRQAKILADVERGELEPASAVFKDALADCEETEKRVHTLAVEAQAAPTAGIENKWRALQRCLEHDALAKFRQTWPLTITTWQTTLRSRSREAEVWDETWKALCRAASPSAKMAVVEGYLKRNPESFYTQFGWKWKDAIARKLGPGEPTSREPRLPVVQDPKPPVVQDPKPPVVTDPKPPVTKEPKPPIIQDPPIR